MDHFAFITDVTVKKELVESRNYSIWLSKKFSEESDETLLLCIKKDIFIHIGSIIEAMLFYVAENLCKGDKALKTVQYSDRKEIYEISPDHKIITHQEKKIALDPHKTDFHALIEALSKIDWFPKDMKDAMTKIRKMRNSVHINTGILCNEDFIKMDISEYKEIANSIMKYCRTLLLK